MDLATVSPPAESTKRLSSYDQGSSAGKEAAQPPTGGATSGPPATFQEVYRAHFRFVWRALGRLGIREADLMDVTQNVFVVVHRQLAGFEARSEITTWLFSICRLVAKDYLRSAPIRREVVVDVRELARRGESGDAPLQRLDTQDLSHLLEAILSKMPEKLRIVFVMFELEEMSGEDIARLLNVPVGTVRSRLRLARAAFQREVKHLGDRSEPGFSGGEAPLPKLGGVS
jgi:RNA polymerase sigma-70 factor (ECF subfamily)